MTILNVMPELMVADFDAGVAWYQTFFGRAPDRRPMDGLVEWQLTEGGGVQVFHDTDSAGTTQITMAVDDMDAHVADLADRGISAEVFDAPSGRFRLATIQDPAGNTITLVQDLGDANAT